MGTLRPVNFKGLCVLMKACVSVEEAAEIVKALTLPVPYTALGRCCVHDMEVMGSGGIPASHQRLDKNPKVPLI